MSARRIAAPLAALACSAALAHGGVGIEDDKCVLRIGAARAHFAGYQPDFRSSQEFCEDIPEVGRAVFVVDFIQPVLRERSVEFRILRDASGRGAKTTLADLGDAAAQAPNLLAELPARTYPRGTLTLEHRFTEPGWYVGVLSATDPASGKVEHSVFPFRVGVRNYWKYLPLPLVVIAFVWLLLRLTRPRDKAAAR